MRKTVVCVLILSFVLIMGVTTALACKGYGTENYYAVENEVYAKITRCACLPVDNYLYASTRAQYKVGEQYYWTNWTEKYGYNVASKTSKTSSSNIAYGICHFRHQCNEGPSAYRYYEFSLRVDQ